MPRWLALASRLWDNGRDDEAAAIGTFWPVLRDNWSRPESAWKRRFGWWNGMR